MSPISSWLTSTALCASLMLSNVNAENQSDQSEAPTLSNQHELVVKFKANNRILIATEVSSLLTQFNERHGSQLSIQRTLGTGAQLIRLESLDEKQSIIDQLKNRSDVEYVVPNYRLYPLATPNDSRYGEQWQYHESSGGINAPAAWDINKGDGAVVAVIDTGYRPHVDLMDNLLEGYDFISNANTARDGDGRDADASDEGDWFGIFECPGAPFNSMNSSWHGTHVAGTIAALGNNSEGVTGIAPGAKVVPVRVLGKCGGTLADIQDGMLWAAGISVDGVPDNRNPAKVMNLSLGGGAACDAAMQDVVNQVTAAGTLVVAAAGNSNADASRFTPAGCDNVLTIASTNRNGGKASYSNYGDVVEVAAPGGETSGGIENGILSTLNTGTERPADDSYNFYQGTSMAAPHAAGVSALLFAQKPSATPAEVTQILIETAREFPSSCDQCGAGIIDAHAALSTLDDHDNQAPTASFFGDINGLTVSLFDDSSDADGTIVSWDWDFGDGSTSTEQDPIHVYPSAGNYLITLVVTDDDGATGSFSVEVEIFGGDDDNTPPEADFSFFTDELTVEFEDNSGDRDGEIVEWAWSFGDGGTSTEQDPTYTYSEGGTFTVTLTVTDDFGASTSISRDVTVEGPPVNDLVLDASVTSFFFIHFIDLTWTGADEVAQVDIYRNGTLRTTTGNDGAWFEFRFFFGSDTYQVCAAGTDICSNEVTVNY